MKGRLFCLLVCIYLLVASREPPWADAHVMYETAVQMVDKHRMDLDLGGPSAFYTFHQGKKYGLYPIGNVLALVPSYALAKLVTSALATVKDAPLDLLTIYLTHLSPTLLAAACCVLFFSLARREGASLRSALFLSLALGTQSILLIYARVAYSEALQAFLFVWLLGLTLRLAEKPTLTGAALAGFAAGWLVATKAVNVLPVAVMLLYLVWRGRGEPRRLLITLGLAALTFLPWAALTLWMNKLKTGSYFDTGYSTAAGAANFSGQFYPALHGFLVSPGKSMFFFSPVLLLGVLGFPSYFRRDRQRALLLLSVIAAVLLPHLWFRAWYGGWVWGPRYTVPITPLLLLPAACWLGPALSRGWVAMRTAAVAALSASGALVQVLGCAFFWDFYIRMAIAVRAPADENFTYVATVFMPQFSPIVMHAWLAWHKLIGTVNMPPDPPFQRIVLNVPNLNAHYQGLRWDFWWRPWMDGRSPAPVWAWIWIAILIIAAVWAAVGLWRRARRSEASVPTQLPNGV
jgi:hypothetical protein